MKRVSLLLCLFCLMINMIYAEEENILKLYEKVLLVGKNKKSLTIGFSYLYDESNFIGIEERENIFYITKEFKYGITNDTEISLSFPYVFKKVNTIGGNESFTSKGSGIGDFSIAIRSEIIKEDRMLFRRYLSPSLTIGILYKFNNGKSNYGSLKENELPISDGHKNVGFEFTISKVNEPLLLYSTSQYIVTLIRKNEGVKVNPGDIFTQRLGIGFSVNPWISIGGGVEGSFFGKSKINSEKIIGSDGILFNLFLNSSYSFSEDLIFSIEATVGITDSEADFTIENSITRYY